MSIYVEKRKTIEAIEWTGNNLTSINNFLKTKMVRQPFSYYYDDKKIDNELMENTNLQIMSLEEGVLKIGNWKDVSFTLNPGSYIVSDNNSISVKTSKEFNKLYEKL